MPKNDGGPAFPPMHDPSTHPSGMTLHQWYAGQAIAGICANPAFFGAWLQQDPNMAANVAMGIADAMLAARGSGESGNG